MSLLKTQSKKTKKESILMLVLVGILLLVVFLSLLVGASSASAIDAFKALINKDYQNSSFSIVFYLRLPRVLGGVFAGIALAVAGGCLQALLHNSMVAPNVIGVNSGAGFAVILVMAIFPSLISVMPLIAFIGALFTTLLIYYISKKSNQLSVILVGIAISSILSAGINAVKVLFPNVVYDISEYLIGGLSSVNYNTLVPSVSVIIIVLTIVLILRKNLDILALGDDVATSLGLNVKKNHLLFLVCASALAGAAVSYAGLIGFIGLLVPHLARSLIGGSYKKVIPFSALLGAILLTFADLISRLIFMPYELPVGILLSLIGGPFFIFLILIRRKS